jgi:methylglutaconyl-CoA hydratase
VIRRIGERYAREYFLTGTRFDAERAHTIGLVNGVVTPGELENEAERWIRDFVHCGPRALESCKELIARCSTGEIEDLKEYTAKMIADLRVSYEGQEGIAAFFEKRKPAWNNKTE